MAFDVIRNWARRIKEDTLALYLAARHPDTPWLARLLIAGVVAYALSPIDLIPDFIPVLGYLDDLILLPLGIALAIRLIPASVMTACRESARTTFEGQRPVNRKAALIIILIWLTATTVIGLWVYRTLYHDQTTPDFSEPRV